MVEPTEQLHAQNPNNLDFFKSNFKNKKSCFKKIKKIKILYFFYSLDGGAPQVLGALGARLVRLRV